MKLTTLIIADPDSNNAQSLAANCERLAKSVLVCPTGSETLKAINKHSPSMLLLSLEITRPNPLKLVRKLRQKHPNMLIVGIYRELAMPVIEQFQQWNLKHFLSYPPSFPQILSIANQYFGIRTRLIARFEVPIDVYRADGIRLGTTRNISAQGMMLTIDSAYTNQSLLLDIALPDQDPQRLRVRARVVQDHAPLSNEHTVRIYFEKFLTNNRGRISKFIQSLDRRTPKKAMK